jgi:hypothetical protein
MKGLYIVMGAFIALLMAACTLDGGNLVGPAGGFVFYDKGSYSDGWRYLECAPESAGNDTWKRAQELCEEYRQGGYDDWRLPDIDELKELLDGDHGMNLNKEDYYWSSSEESGFAWGIQIDDENNAIPSTHSKSNKFEAWPVRRF